MTKSTRKPLSTPRKSSGSFVQRLLSPVVLISILLVAIVGVIAYAVWQTVDATNQASRPIEGLEEYPGQIQGHVDGLVTYEQTPPVGGTHNAVWQNCGVYTAPVANENAVHSLEHGAIWITYQPDLAADQVAALQSLTRQSGYRLLSPYPDLPSPIVASAWGYQLKLEKADDPRLLSFIQRYEQNPLGPEPGAVCTGGTGQPS